MSGRKVKWEMSDGCICYCKNLSLSELNTVRNSKTVNGRDKEKHEKTYSGADVLFSTGPPVRAVLFSPSFVNFKEDSLSQLPENEKGWPLSLPVCFAANKLPPWLIHLHVRGKISLHS